MGAVFRTKLLLVEEVDWEYIEGATDAPLLGWVEERMIEEAEEGLTDCVSFGTILPLALIRWGGDVKLEVRCCCWWGATEPGAGTGERGSS